MSGRARRRLIVRWPHVTFERWRIGIQWRVYWRFGQPQFEFVFLVGRPKRVQWMNPEPLEVDDGFGI